MAAPFGTLLRQYRRAAGLTQVRLADLSGVSAQAISMLERGTRMYPRQDTVSLLVKALGLPDARAESLRAAATRAPFLPADRPSAAAGAVAPPRWLPPAVGDFTGRGAEVAELCATLSSATRSPALVVTAIDGMGGIGKTTLAVRAAHLMADEFPDGQLYVNLRGFGPGERMSPGEAVNQILASLGVATAEQGTVEQQSGRYRSALAGKRVVVVLDNAADVDQVLPLLPGTAGCAAIVTSRQSLAGLPGARHLHLDVLSAEDSVALLTAVIGAERAAAEPEAAADVVRRCGQLPLAIRMAGARLAARPGWPVAVMATQLSDERRRLDELELRDAGVRASFSASLRGLAASDDSVDAEAAACFPLLGTLDSADVGLAVAARLLNRPMTDAERMLERLVDFHLLETPSQRRYRMHDLLRSYAREYGAEHLASEAGSKALIRVIRLYNTVAWRNYATAVPTHIRHQYVDEAWLDDAAEIVARDTELRWLIDESENLVTTIQQAASDTAVPQTLVSQLAIASMQHTNVVGHWRQLAAIARSSLRAAITTGDRTAQAFAHHDVAAAMSQLGNGPVALSEMQTAVRLFTEAGDEPGEAMALCNLAYSFERHGQQVEEGVRAGERALRLCASRDLRHLEATTCLALGLLHGHAGHRERELSYHERSRAIYAEINYDRGHARAMFNMGIAHQVAGRTDEAVRSLRDAVEMCDRLDLTDTAAEARTHLAGMINMTGEHAAAQSLCREALDLAQAISSEISEARARHVLGEALDASGRHADARREWSAAEVIYERLGAPMAEEVRLLMIDAERTAT